MTFDNRIDRQRGRGLAARALRPSLSWVVLAVLLVGLFGCPNDQRVDDPDVTEPQVNDEQQEQNKEFVEEVLDIVAEGDIEALDEVIHPDFVNHNPAPGFDDDREGLKESTAVLHEAFAEVDNTAEEMVAEDDKVAVRVTTDLGTHEGEFMGIPPTGEEASYDAIGILRIEDDMIIERWAQSDTEAFMEQLGVAEPMPENDMPQEQMEEDEMPQEQMQQENEQPLE